MPVYSMNRRCGPCQGDRLQRSGETLCPGAARSFPRAKKWQASTFDRIWHRAKVKLEGESVVLHAPGVNNAAHGTGGMYGKNLYNKLLPMTPFIYYDRKEVNAPDGKPRWWCRRSAKPTRRGRC